jgi:hypothetical protein
MACHTKGGYRSMKRLLHGRDLDGISGFLDFIAETDPTKNTYLKFMPPVVGTTEERRALAAYLNTFARIASKKD